MIHSENLNEISAALAKAQGEIRGAVKDASNPHFRSQYATLASVWEACRDALSKNGIAVVQSPTSDEAGNIAVETILTHSSGQWISGAVGCKPGKADAQGVGSVITYLRRYSLAAMVGVAPEDDDAESGVGRGTPTNTPSMEARSVSVSRGVSKAKEKANGPAARFVHTAVSEISSLPTLDRLKAWWEANASHIAALSEEDRGAVEKAKDDRKAALATPAAA